MPQAIRDCPSLAKTDLYSSKHGNANGAQDRVMALTHFRSSCIHLYRVFSKLDRIITTDAGNHLRLHVLYHKGRRGGTGRGDLFQVWTSLYVQLFREVKESVLAADTGRAGCVRGQRCVWGRESGDDGRTACRMQRYTCQIVKATAAGEH